MSKSFPHNDSRTILAVKLLLFIALVPILIPLRAESSSTSSSSHFDSVRAFTYTKEAVAFGERPSGSAANLKLRQWILAELKQLGGQVSTDDFTGHTPTGPVEMENIILKFPGTSGGSIAVTGHFDSKKIPMVHFLGANDGGSSTGFLLEFAHVAAHMAHQEDLYVVFFDGEEAIGEWSQTDSVYGSRHLATKWASDGTLAHLTALINVDMIGDKELDVMNDGNSAKYLRDKTLAIATRLGYGAFFHKEPAGIDDDHMPFAEAGVNVVDLIDFNYGPNNAYWHQATDTMDKLSAHSLQIVGDVVVALVEDLDSKKK